MAFSRIPGPRFRFNPKNRVISLAVLLVFLLIVTAVTLALRKNGEDARDAAVVVTPFVPPPTPELTPPPTPTPQPIDIPEGKTMEKVVIVIDPGHGESDPGTVSPGEDLYEKDVTLDIGLKVRDLLTDAGINTIMTRDRDKRLDDSDQKHDLWLRAQVANDNNATLFVSIHVNAYDLKSKGARQVNGMEVIYHRGKQPMYDDFDSKDFAEIMAKTIQQYNGIYFRGLISNDLSVLRNTRMPAVLVETAFITNQEDYERLKSDEFRTNTAIGIVEGIKQALEAIQAFEYEGDLYVFKQVDAQ
ncbi:MAG: N-acetylmuramoyl-L-alanine amidase [Clostridiaceae bacterium]|nr:N-acetylmuramoyl-L-alanine amidase [Clostridiaceae bacterium]